MPDIKANALMPKGETNGLATIAGQLVAEGLNRKPRRLHAVVGLVDVRRVATDADTGDELATIRFRRVELLREADLAAAEQLIRRALEDRLGETVLPLDLEDDLRAAFEGLDVDVPEGDGHDQGDEPDLGGES